jgi:hypothetical protein
MLEKEPPPECILHKVDPLYSRQSNHQFNSYTMGLFKFNSRRVSRKEKRNELYKALQLPVSVINELKMYQNAYDIQLSEEEDQYGNPIPIHLMMGQMLTRWMDNVKMFDRDVYDDVQLTKMEREENPLRPAYYVDPTEGEVWELEYFAERDGEEVDLKPDPYLWFAGKLNGRTVGVEDLINEEWTFMNDVGIEITLEQAKDISRKILGHGLQERIRFGVLRK